jgi:hypothetical protein
VYILFWTIRYLGIHSWNPRCPLFGHGILGAQEI